MVLAIILICCLSFASVIAVLVCMVAAAIKLGKGGNASYKEMRPHIQSLQKSTSLATERSQGMTARGLKLSQTWAEIGETLTKIGESFEEIKKSPLVRIAGFTGNLRSR